MKLTLQPFEKSQVKTIEPWFHDPETTKWLGDTTWIQNVFRLQNEAVGTEFRGTKKLAYFPFVAYDGDRPVGYIDGGIGDRYARYEREKDGHESLHDIENVHSMAISYVVDPTQRGKGYGVAVIHTLLARPELESVKIFFAGVEPKNTASIKMLEKAGFTSDYQPDFEGMIYFLLRR